MDARKYNFKMCALRKPLVKNVIHDIAKKMCAIYFYYKKFHI